MLMTLEVRYLVKISVQRDTWLARTIVERDYDISIVSQSVLRHQAAFKKGKRYNDSSANHGSSCTPGLSSIFSHRKGRRFCRGDIIKQAQRVLENLRIVLGTLDCDFHDVVSARVFLTDMRNFETVNRVYAAYFDEDLPARTCVAVTELAGKADIEIDLVVYKPHLSSS